MEAALVGWWVEVGARKLPPLAMVSALPCSFPCGLLVSLHPPLLLSSLSLVNGLKLIASTIARAPNHLIAIPIA